jgi:peptidoglycan-associated lipoprotein
MLRLSSVLFFTLALAATCKRNKNEITELPDDVTAGQGNEDGADGADAPVIKDVPDHVQTLVSNFQRVYFDFDASELSPESRSALDANVALMQKHVGVKVQIQGHADERGATEYNLALGNRRANAVKDYLVGQGIAPSRLTIISYGEEAPLEGGSNERAWSKNRRAEFVVTWGADSTVKSSTD